MFDLGPDALRRRPADFFDRQGIGRLEDRQGVPEPDRRSDFGAGDQLFGESPSRRRLDPWRDDVLSGKPPTLYPVGTGELARIGIGLGLVTLIGGAPGAGKTALTLHWVLDAMTATPSLKALILNVEMSPNTLLDRQLARLADLDGSHETAAGRSMRRWTIFGNSQAPGLRSSSSPPSLARKTRRGGRAIAEG
jgi:hypothetical protein